MAVAGIQGMVGTQEDPTAVAATMAVIHMVRGIIPAGTAGGGIGITPAVIGGVLGTMVIQVGGGGGLIPTPIHIITITLIRTTILIPIPIPILIPLR